MQEIIQGFENYIDDKINFFNKQFEIDSGIIKQQLNQLYKKYYEQYSKDLVKRNPEYINRWFYNKKARAEMIWMKSNLNRTDFRQIPRLWYSKLSKWLIPWWSYNKE